MFKADQGDLIFGILLIILSLWLKDWIYYVSNSRGPVWFALILYLAAVICGSWIIAKCLAKKN